MEEGIIFCQREHRKIVILNSLENTCIKKIQETVHINIQNTSGRYIFCMHHSCLQSTMMKDRGIL